MAVAPYGTMKDGSPVSVFTLTGNKGLALRVLDMGGTIIGIDVPLAGGGSRNVVVGLADLAAYEAKAWFNCLIGRYANRLKNGFTLDGQHYPLTQDENGVTLHGGRPLSWGIRLWRVIAATDSTLTFGLVSADGDQGFPGNMSVEVTYSVTDDAVRIDYRATTDAATPVNLTNHLYLNLAGRGSVEAQLLEIEADAFTPTDAHQIPTGELAPVTGTAFDFRAPVAIGARLRTDTPQLRVPRGYDHNYVLRKSAPGALEPAVRMEGPDGVRLTLSTTEPGIQVYSANSLDGKLVSAGGEMIRQGDALALETQHFPDSPNQPAFPSTILRPGESFHSTTVFQFAAEQVAG